MGVPAIRNIPWNYRRVFSRPETRITSGSYCKRVSDKIVFSMGRDCVETRNYREMMGTKPLLDRDCVKTLLRGNVAKLWLR